MKMKNEKKGLGKFALGAVLGAGLGVLFAPKSGKETREDISKKLKEIMDNLKEVDAEEVKDKITKKVKEIENELKDLDKEKVLKIAKTKAKKIQKKADELYKLAKEKGTPVLEKTCQELKTTTANALKKVVAKLEEE